MKNKLILSLLLVLASFTLVSCMQKEETLSSEISSETSSEISSKSSSDASSEVVGEYKKITVDEAISMMNGDVIILDVRTPEEFEAGHIQNAILLPDYEISDRYSEVLPNKEKTILVYCRSGNRSANASRELIALGYKNVFDFGGIETDWTGEVVTE